MNCKMIGRFISRILMIEGIFLLPPLVIALCRAEYSALKGFTVAFAVAAVLSVFLYFLCRRATTVFNAKEGFVCVGLSWIALSLVGCLPFWVSGEIPAFVDALFEIVSGFTTTGASVLSDVEALSKSLLYWRCFSNWLGGMGILVFLLAFTPSDGQGTGFTMHLLRAESPGPDVGKLVPRMRKTARILYVMYLILTFVNLIFLLCGKMSFFDAICTAFSTAGTGGFGIYNDSLASFSPYIQTITAVFILLFGVNFSCYYLLLLGHVRSVFRDEELRLYLGLVAGSILLITWNLCSTFGAPFGKSLLDALFQVSSVITTTGFSSVNFDLWPSFSKAILLLLMLVGGCAGSTAGGLKCTRLLLLLKNLKRNIQKSIHPNKVLLIRNNDKVVSETIITNTNAYLAAYVLILVLSFLIVSIDNFSVTTNFSAVVACFNNIGPGFDAVGPMCNFGGYSILSKLVLVFDMLAGRLEIFPILMLFSLNTWKRS